MRTEVKPVKKLFFLLLFIAQFSVLSPAFSQVPNVIKTKLANGMTILILERHTSPTVAFRIGYSVGAVNDIPGKSGLAHFFEHMAFKGSTTMNSKDYKKEKPLLDALEKAADAY